MPIFLVLLLFLSGCSSTVQDVETKLNEYASAAALNLDLTDFLSGQALRSAEQSAHLIAELGLQGFGVSVFSKTSQLSPETFQSCLDVSGTQFRDRSGVIVALQRTERQLVEVTYQGERISALVLKGTPC